MLLSLCTTTSSKIGTEKRTTRAALIATGFRFLRRNSLNPIALPYRHHNVASAATERAPTNSGCATCTCISMRPLKASHGSCDDSPVATDAHTVTKNRKQNINTFGIQIEKIAEPGIVRLTM